MDSPRFLQVVQFFNQYGSNSATSAVILVSSVVNACLRSAIFRQENLHQTRSSSAYGLVQISKGVGKVVYPFCCALNLTLVRV